MDQAKDNGWKPDLDRDFLEIEHQHACARPDRPSSIIAYLERVLMAVQSVKWQEAPFELTPGVDFEFPR